MIVVKYKAGVETTDVLDSYFDDYFFEVVNEGLNKYFDNADIIVTSGTDGTHSTHSMHYKSMAVDLRIRHLKTNYLKYGIGSEPFASALYHAYGYIAETMPEYHFIVHAKDGKKHVHCQYGDKNIISTGEGDNKNLYLK